jgi:hypothetical protein
LNIVSVFDISVNHWSFSIMLIIHLKMGA